MLLLDLFIFFAFVRLELKLLTIIDRIESIDKLFGGHVLQVLSEFSSELNIILSHPTETVALDPTIEVG